MKVVTPRQMNQIDSMSINGIGIPGIVLMENAALKVIDEIVPSIGPVIGKHITLFAGKGNNGGDALAVARHLYNKGANLDIYILSQKDSLSGDAKTNLDILENIGLQVIELLDGSQLESLPLKLSGTHLIIDGIFGTGLKGTLKGLILEVIEAINRSDKTVLSIDIPSGINGETGDILGTCVRAHKTVTFGLPKVGLVVHPGCEYAGELIVADIGIPSKVVGSFDIQINTIEQKYVSNLFPKRIGNSSKGDYGRVFIISGSAGMTGAGCLTAASALRTGAGLVYIGVPSSLVSTYDSNLLESITVPLEDGSTGFLSKTNSRQILDRAKGMSVAAIGPGLSARDEIVELIHEVIPNMEIPLVLDADALNVIAKDVSVLKRLKVPAVLTPHPGEMARLLGITSREVQNNRIEIARAFSSNWNVTTVLKGSRTIVALPDGTLYINCTGNPGMATGGTGDVLTGVIAGLIGQGITVENAAVCGVYLHGLAGDLAAGNKGIHGIIASDLVDFLPYAFKETMSKRE